MTHNMQDESQSQTVVNNDSDALFVRTKSQLDNEIAAYTSVYDNLLYTKTENELQAWTTLKSNFDSDIANGVADFDKYYNLKVAELRNHVVTQRTLFETAVSNAEDAYLGHRDRLKTETLHSLLSKVYSIRVILDSEDDFLADPTLEAMCDLHAQIVQFKTILWDDDEARDMFLLSQLFKAATGQDPPSVDRNTLIPIMQQFFITLTESKLSGKSQYLMSNISAPASYSGYTTPPTQLQKSTWYLIKQSFASGGALNNRFNEGQIVDDWDSDAIRGQAMNLLVTKYLEKLPYSAPTPTISKSIFQWRSNRSRLDPVLDALDNYCSEEEFRTYVFRGPMSLFLRENADSSLVVDLQTTPDDLVQNYDYYYPHDSFLDFDNSAYLRMHTQNHVLEYKRALSSFHSITQWSVHLGLIHLLVGDDWNYHFCKNVPSSHPLVTLIGPLTRGTAQSINLGSIILVNDFPFSFAGLISNLTPNALRRLTSKETNNVEQILHFPTVDALVPIETPVKRTLRLWWTAIDKLIEDFVALYYVDSDSVDAETELVAWIDAIAVQGNDRLEKMKKIIKIMYFNPVVHELFSNEQLAHDALEQKIQLLVHKTSPEGLPSSFVHNKLIEVLMATSGDAPSFLDDIFVHDETNSSLFETFQTSLRSMGDLITQSPTEYSSLLHPELIESSICW